MRHPFLWLCLSVLLAISSGCATVAVKNPEAERRLLAANEALGALQNGIEELYGDLETVRQDLRAFYDRPGWLQMREIIVTLSSADDSEDLDIELQTLAETESAEWTAAWAEPWEDRFRDYLELVRRCTALEARRIGLQAELFKVQGMFLGVSVIEYSSGRYNQGQASDEVVAFLSRSAEELGSYSVDEVGLYEVR